MISLSLFGFLWCLTIQITEIHGTAMYHLIPVLLLVLPQTNPVPLLVHCNFGQFEATAGLQDFLFPRILKMCVVFQPPCLATLVVWPAVKTSWIVGRSLWNYLPPSQRQPAQDDPGRRVRMGGNRSLLLFLLRISTGALLPQFISALKIWWRAVVSMVDFCQLGLMISQLEIVWPHGPSITQQVLVGLDKNGAFESHIKLVVAPRIVSVWGNVYLTYCITVVYKHSVAESMK